MDEHYTHIPAQPASDPYAQPAAEPYAQPASDPYAQPAADPYAQPAPIPLAPVPVVPLPAAPVAEPRRRWSGWAVAAAGILGGLIGSALATGAVFAVLQLPAAQQSRLVESVERPASGTPVVSVVSSRTAQPAEAVAAKVTQSVVNVGIDRRVVDPLSGQSAVQRAGNGSGVIIRSDGYILTNNHVVAEADRIVVHVGLEDKVAKVVGTDPSTDIAVVKIEATGLAAADLGDSDSLQVGEAVIAVGSPFGLDKTVTSGIISALHRSGETGTNSSVYTNLVQTDAAINPGNSGGALADMDGRVIGINTLIQSPSGQIGAPQSAGIGFAIPIKLAKLVADQLILTGKAKHAFLGVQMATLDAQTAAQMKLTVTSGALIQDVVVGSPAEKAGIRKGDVIVGVGDVAVQSAQDVVSAIREKGVGDPIDLKVNRAGKEVALKAIVGEAPAAQ